MVRDLLPYNRAVFITLSLLRAVLTAISYKKPQVTKSYLYIHAMMLLSLDFLPTETETISPNSLITLRAMTNISLVAYFSFSFNYWANTLTLIACSFLKFIVINPVIYPDSELTAKFLIPFVFCQLLTAYYCAIFHCMYSLAGHIYVQSYLSNLGNE